jgi:succinoglycan biosynthesis protein ExoM
MSIATDITVEVCICTYRRATLSDAVRSVLAQNLPGGVRLSVLVIDNDATPSAERAVAALAAEAPVPVRYAHRPAGNISIARNGALDLCGARYLAFLDDDEIAEPGWIAALLAVARQSGAEVILGPVRAVYSAGAPGWMRDLDLHSTRPVEVGGTIRTGYTCNVLLDRESPAVAGLRFDLSLGRSGGEDTAFFAEVFARGGRIVHAEGAIVTEAVPAERARFGWLARRRFRMGQTHGRILGARTGLAGRARGGVIAGAKVAFCAGAALAGIASPARRNAAVLRGCLHAGTISGLAGAAPIELYGPVPRGAAGGLAE